MEYSRYQKDIFDWIENGKGNAVVEAVAGSGKTFCLIEAAKRLPPESCAVFLAFNKRVADELVSRLPKNVAASTLNAVGFRMWRNHVGHATVNANKLREYAKGMLPPNEFFRYGLRMVKLVEFIRMLGVVPKGCETGPRGLIEDTDELWERVAVERDILPDNAWDMRNMIDNGRILLNRAIAARHEVDFGEQIYFPVIWGLRQGAALGFDWVFIDELQDLDPVQREIVSLLLRPGGRVMGVGDRKQCLYHFRGASIDSIEQFASKFDCCQLPLSICYRCPTSHLDLARKLVPWIEAREGAPKGRIMRLPKPSDFKFPFEEFEQDDLVVCRNNSHLVALAYSFLANRVPCRILGRDIASGLSSLIKKMKASTIWELERKLDGWADKEKAKLLRKDPDADTSAVDEKRETLQTFIDNASERTVEGVMADINSMFSDDDKPMLTLSTVHKAKGATVKRCFILKPELLEKPWPKMKPEDVQVLANARYVALTRATETLGYIDCD